MDVTGPKGPQWHTGPDLLPWAHNQLTIADQIMDNPGGGLVFATTSVGQVRAALAESGETSEEERLRWDPVVRLLEQTEDDMVRRRFEAARSSLGKALEALSGDEARQTA